MCDEAIACEIDAELKVVNASLYRNGRRRHFVDEPVVRMQGPILLVLLPDG